MTWRRTIKGLPTPNRETVALLTFLNRIRDDESARAVADLFAYLSHIARTRADEIERHAQLWQDKSGEGNSPLDMMQAAIDSGMSVSDAAIHLQRTIGADTLHILAAWRHRQTQEARKQRRARDLEIMRLAGRGWSNKEIAAKIEEMGFGTIHPKHVSRIVRAKVKANAVPHPKLYRRDNT